jgi:hypothetical protein|tara:strand:- start:923 stop:1204 length:282 start_codon:yes stop_codon:yes gene_type:complete
LNKIKSFWIDSYQSDKVAFAFELVSFVFTVAASLTLAMNATNPNMSLIYPFFFVGSTTQCYAAYRRGAAWVMLLTGYFGIVNIYGYLVATHII